MHNWNEVSTHHQHQLLDVLFHYLPQDMRRTLMLEVPAAYNAACGREVVTVRYTEEGRGDVR